MESITEITSTAFKSDLLERLSSQIHESPIATRRGVEQAVPISIAGLASHASSMKGAEQLLGAFRGGDYPHADARQIAETSLDPDATSRLARSGTGFMSQIFGSRLPGVVDSLAGQSGVSKASAATLLGLAAPLVLDAVGKEAGSRRLDARGLSHFLADQGRRAEGVLPASVSSVLGTGTRQREAYGAARPAEVARRREPKKRTWLWIAAGIALLALFAAWLARRGQAPSLPDVDLPKPSVDAPTAPPLPEQQQAAPVRPDEPAAQQVQPAAPAPAAELEAAPAAEPEQAVAPEPEPAVAPEPEQAVAPEPEQAAAPEPPAGGVAEPTVLSAAAGVAALESFLTGQAPTPQRFVLEGIEFSSGSSQVGSSSVLDGVAQTLAEHEDARIRIEGHADATGDPMANEALSEARAVAVKDYLVAKGMTEDRIEARGRGADEPLAPNETAEDRAQNRRVELIVLQR